MFEGQKKQILDGLTVYKISDLVRKTGRDARTIKKLHRFIPIKIENARTRNNFKNGITNQPYIVNYIDLRDIKDYLKEEYNKDLIID